MGLTQGVLEADMSSLEILISGTRAQLAFFMERRDFTKMQLKEVTAWSTIELLRSPEQVEALGVGLDLVASLLRSCIDDGYLIDDDPELMARMMIATQQVRLAIWMDRGCKEDPNHLADAALRHLLRSYCKTGQLASALEVAGLRAEP
jgi:hypothetical protein